MPRVRRPLPEALDRVFTRSEARAAGVASRRLDAPDVEHLAFGVYRRVPRAPDASPHPAATWRSRQRDLARATQRSLPEHAFFCGRTAAVLWNLPVPAGTDERVEVGAIVPDRPPERAGIRGIRLQAHLASRTTLSGTPVIGAADLWCTLGPRLADDDLVALGDAIVRRERIPGTKRLKRPPLADIEALERAANAGRRAGIARLRRALQLLSPDSASAPETHLRLRCRAWGFPKPELNSDVLDANGRLLGCSDLVFRDYRVALEYEGDHHRVDARQWDRDIAKMREYTQAGWMVIRVTSRMLYRDDFALRMTIEQALLQRGWAQQTRHPA